LRCSATKTIDFQQAVRDHLRHEDGTHLEPGPMGWSGPTTATLACAGGASETNGAGTVKRPTKFAFVGFGRV
jgi:hypothetical protein